MKIVEIDASSPLLEEVRAINEAPFPDVERMPIEVMFTFPIDTDLLGFFHEDHLVGFSLILKNSTTVFVVLFAIDRQHRGKGYGSAAIQQIKARYGGKQVVLDFEEIADGAANYDQRVARKRFYLRNGFHETGHFTVLFGDKYEVVCSEETLDKVGLQSILTAIHQHTPCFEEQLI